VDLEIGHGYVRYLHDHVLDGLVENMGLTVLVEESPFEPESGAYGANGHGHQHG
jgi:urease accessory protein